MEEALKLPSYSVEGLKDIQNKFGGVVESVDDSEIDGIMEEIKLFSDYLKSKYPNPKEYAAYHALIGSTINETTTSILHDDFPGEDSVEAFLAKLESEYLG